MLFPNYLLLHFVTYNYLSSNPVSLAQIITISEV